MAVKEKRSRVTMYWRRTLALMAVVMTVAVFFGGVMLFLHLMMFGY